MLSEKSTKNLLSLLIVAGAIITVLGSLVYLASKAKAADKGDGGSIFADAPVAPPREGAFAYFGVHGGLSMANTEVSAGVTPFNASLDGVGSHGAIGGLHGGVDYVFANRLFAGLWGSYSWQNTETTLKLGPLFSGSAEFGDSYALGGRVGYDMGKGKIYALAGYRHTDLDWSASVLGTPVNLSKAGLPSSMSGLDLGLGAGIMINKNLEWDVKGIWTQYQDEDIGTGKGHPVLSTDQLQILTSLNFKF